MTKDKKTSLFVRWDEIRKRNDVSSVSIAMNKRNERGGEKEGEKKKKNMAAWEWKIKFREKDELLRSFERQGCN